ncbi:ABC transporter permease [Bacillus sp. J14TS2]|uniref:ABC transporter permease n=1 Tax=unclassified Bacillus (in: firmicutes) TaxID=185979 RepID=UPI001A97212A|nr:MULTISPECIES: ABC transporter permease subunit [unclassified Bacillus (in: firmicutes)]MBO0991982.1 sugar ABC transporter permease [Bacillus sp. SD088]GIN72338.1 ABC transporter permease [Bacillus sp. J14TS2]
MGNKTFLGRLKNELPLQLMVLPGVIFMIIFGYLPIYGLIIAFKSFSVTDTISSAPWVGWENFKIAFTDKFFWEAVVNTLAISFIKLLIGFISPIILAIMIFELKDGKFKKMVQTISYLPHFLSWVVLGGMLISWLSTTGLLSTLLVNIGLMDQPRNFLVNANNYWAIASLSEVWKSVGWGTILYLATMAGIDPSYYEAAKMDGATKLQRIWHVTLPNMKFIIILMFILAVGGILNSNLDQTLVLINPLNASKAEVINSYVFKIGLAQGDFSYATAVGLAISVISLLLVLITHAVTKRLNDNKSVF